MAGARIQLKRATAASWASNNPVLYAGEIGLETDTNKFKIGDGTTAFNSLAYFNGNLTGSSLNDLADVTIVSASNGDFLRWNGTAWINDAVNLSTDTVGNYMVNVAGGTGVTITHTPGEGSTASVAIGQDVATSASVEFAALTVNGETEVAGHILPSTNEVYDLGSSSKRFRDIYLSGTSINLGGAEITSDGTTITFPGGLTGDLAGNADTASELETARTISLGGDLSGSASFDGSTDITISATVQPNSVALGTDTTGNYLVDVVAGTGVTVSHTPGEGSSASIAIGQSVATTASVTFAHVSADVTGDVTGNADTATTLQTARAISLAGDLSGSVSFDGSQNVTITAQVEPNSVALGTDTTGNFMSDVVAGTGVSISHTPGEGSSASIAIGQAVGTSDNPSFAGVTADNVQIGISNATEIDTVSGNLTIDSAGGTVTVDDDLVITGSLTVSGSATYVNTETLTVDDNVILLNSNQTGSPSQNAGIEIERGSSDNVELRWNEATDSWELTEDGTTYKNIAVGQDVETSSSVTFAAVTAPLIGNASTASTLETARAISLSGDISGSASFDGSANITITADVQPNSVALGTDTTGNYLVDVVADSSGITVNHTAGEGSSASLSLVQDINTSASVTFANVTADLIGDVTGNADTATTLATARAISLAGDLSGSASFDGSQNITITADVQPNSVALGTDTTGNYVNDVVSGTGVTVTHTPGEGSSASIAIGQDVATTASVTFAHVSADVTGDLTGNADTATTLETARTISLAGDLSGSVSFDGSSNVTITASVEPNSVALGTDTTGNYVSDVVAGTGISVTHTPGEGSSASVALNAWLNDLGDVVITGSPERFQTLGYDGAGWVNSYAPVVSYVRNAEATTLTAGTVVYLFGGTGDHASVKRADNNSDTTSSKTVGVVTASIAAGQNGSVITRGYANGMDLSAYNAGDILWLDTNGQVTTTKPTAPKHLVFIGVVVRATNNGIIYVATQNGYELEELHDVKVSSLTNGDFLKYVSASGVWVNDQINLGTDTVGDYVQNLVAGTGVTLSNNSGEGSTPTVAIGQDVGTSASVVFYNLETTHDLTIGGNLYVSGSVVTENQTSLQIDDPFIYLNGSSSVSNVDLGIAGNYNDGTYRHAGIFRDATDGKFKFFDSYEPEPSSPIDTGHASYSPAPVVAETFESTIATGTAPFTVASTTEVTNLHADTASTLHNARAISLSGDLSGSVSFDGSSDIVLTASVQPNSVALGTDTTGNYMVGVAEGTGVTIIHTPGEASTASISIGQDVATTASVSFAHVAAPVTGNVTGNLTGNVTGDVSGNAGTATALQTPRTINLGGDLSGSASFNGTSDITITAAVQPNSVALGTDTTGNYMSDLTQGTGVTITHTPGEGSNATIAIGQAVDTSSSVTFAAVTSPVIGNVTGNADTATALQTPRAISLTGDLSGSVSFSGSSDVSINATVQPNSIALGTDTTGNFVSDVVAGTGVTVTHTPGEGSSATIAIGQAVGTSSTVQFASIELGNATDTTISRPSAGRIAVEGINVPTISSSDTLSNKSIALGSNTVTGTLAQFNTAVTDADFVSISGAETLTNKTLTSPQINSGTASAMTITGSLTAGGGTGTSGQFLQSTGTGVQWATASPSASVTTISTVSATEVYSFDASTYGAADLIVTAKQGSKKTAMKTFVSHDGNSTASNVNTSRIEYGDPVIPLTVSTSMTTGPNVATWVTTTSPYPSNNLLSVGYENGKWFIGGASGQIAHSTDAVTWTTVETYGGYSGIPYGVAYSGTRYVVAGENGRLAYSTDLITWTTRTSQFGSTSTIHNVVYGNNIFAISGQAGRIVSSTNNGTSWILRTSNITNTETVTGLAYGGGTWVAGGYSGSLRTSTDTITWTTRTKANVGGISSIGYGGGLFVAVGSSGGLASSTDGITWTTRTSNFGSTSINSVAYGNGLWVAASQNGQIRTSTDAITWVTRTSNFGNTHIRDVAYGNSLWLAVGYSGQARNTTVTSTVSVTATITDANSTSATVKVLPTLIEA